MFLNYQESAKMGGLNHLLDKNIQYDIMYAGKRVCVVLANTTKSSAKMANGGNFMYRKADSRGCVHFGPTYFAACLKAAAANRSYD